MEGGGNVIINVLLEKLKIKCKSHKSFCNTCPYLKECNIIHLYLSEVEKL